MDDITNSTAEPHSAVLAPVEQLPTPANTFVKLPTELRSSILERCADLDDLRSLVGSCTAYHQAYLSARAPILSLVLKRIIGPWLEDLLLVVEAGTLTQTFNWAKQQEPVIALLDRYRRGTLADWHGTNAKSQFAPDIFPLEQCLSLVQAKRMVDWTCDRICRQYASKLGDDSPPMISPSTIEMIRLSRAICRHEAFCALMPSACQSTIWNADAARNVFLRIFPTWEIEEIACIYESLQYEYGCMLIEIAKHFCSLHPTADVNGWKKEEGYFDAFEPFDIRPGCDCFDRGRETLASLGPSRLYEMHRTRCLKFISDAHEDGFDHDHEWRLTPGYLLPGLLHDTYDDDTSLHHIFPAEEHVLLERCSTEQHVKHKQPSTGWLWLQLDDERTLADARRRYAETTPLGHFDMRYWGYVFWDEERMQATGLPSEYAPFVLNSIFDWDKWRTNEEDAWTRMKAAPISDHWDFVVFTKRVVQSSQFLTADRD